MCSFIKSALKKCDLFSQSNFLRLNGDSEYSTATGGFISLSIIILFIVLFFNMGLKTFKKQVIYSEKYTEFQIDPRSYTIKLGPGGDMMFAIGIFQVDLNSNLRYFDVKVLQQYYSSGFELLSSEEIQLKPCIQKHFYLNDEFN